MQGNGAEGGVRMKNILATKGLIFFCIILGLINVFADSLAANIEGNIHLP